MEAQNRLQPPRGHSSSHHRLKHLFEAELYKETPYLQGNKVKLSYVI